MSLGTGIAIAVTVMSIAAVAIFAPAVVMTILNGTGLLIGGIILFAFLGLII